MRANRPTLQLAQAQPIAAKTTIMTRYNGLDSTRLRPWYMPPMTTFVNVMSQSKAFWNQSKKVSIQLPSGIRGLAKLKPMAIRPPSRSSQFGQPAEDRPGYRYP